MRSMAGRYAVRVIGVVLAIAVVVTAGLALRAWSEEPLAVGSWAVSGAEKAEPQAFPGQQVYEFRFVEHSEIMWGVEVRNVLGVPVTIRGLNSVLRGTNAFLVGEDLQLPSGTGIGFEPEMLRPFSPVELAPDERVFLMVSQRFTDCAWARERWDPGTGLVLEELRLDVTVLGIPKVSHVALPFNLSFRAPDTGDC